MVEKHKVEKQKYEDYWKLTLEYTDIYGEKFNKNLKIIIDFIDSNMDIPYSAEKYNSLQKILEKDFPKSDNASTRKAINQFVKLGFVEYNLLGVHKETYDFINTTVNEQKKSLFSKIVYLYSSFQSSVTHYNKNNEINFLVRTLEQNKKLTKNDLETIMQLKLGDINKEFLTKEEIERYKKEVSSDFAERKYNQISYLYKIFNLLDGINVHKNKDLSLEEIPDITISKEKSTTRDPYLQKLYKNQLQKESKEFFGKIKCMVEKLDYPALIASHIKPYKNSNPYEEFDVNNGLLLSKNIDHLFDNGYISFQDNGSILFSKSLSQELKFFLNDYSIEDKFINTKRCEYLKYHRDNIFKNS